MSAGDAPHLWAVGNGMEGVHSDDIQIYTWKLWLREKKP